MEERLSICKHVRTSGILSSSFFRKSFPGSSEPGIMISSADQSAKDMRSRGFPFLVSGLKKPETRIILLGRPVRQELREAEDSFPRLTLAKAC